ncbi:MAG TPA: hypothetical protein PK876_03140 [Elusimicrobiota bacterium]|nr:hypothetical protein [Elusimicrobiota bacterium]
MILLGLGTLTLSFHCMRIGREPFATWFYNFAWWSYILVIDGLVYRRRGESLLLSYPRRFLLLAAWSSVLWFLFEALNFRLNNWFYVGLPSSSVARWIGYFMAYATVVPALFETMDCLDAAGFVRDKESKYKLSSRVRGRVWGGVGIVLLVLPMIWPRYFFPLVWGGFAFLVEPWNERWGQRGLWADLREGRLRRVILLLWSGLICGGLWEFWNFWARAKWEYSVPFVGSLKMFEMPVLGYLGFPVFAVECFIMTMAVVTLWNRLSRIGRWSLGFVGLAFGLLSCWAIDHFTVRSFYG